MMYLEIVLGVVCFFMFLIAVCIFMDTYSNSKQKRVPQVVAIKFKAMVPDEHLVMNPMDCYWRLGLGRCGKVATSIDVGMSGRMEHHYVVRQWCSDGEYKEFIYKTADIVGRIVVTYSDDTEKFIEMNQ